jgi:hypothetical protein
VKKFHDENYLKEIMSSWLIEEKMLFHKTYGIYNTLNLREPYIYVIAFMCRLYVQEDCIHFKDEWIPIVYGVVTKGLCLIREPYYH